MCSTLLTILVAVVHDAQVLNNTSLLYKHFEEDTKSKVGSVCCHPFGNGPVGTLSPRTLLAAAFMVLPCASVSFPAVLWPLCCCISLATSLLPRVSSPAQPQTYFITCLHIYCDGGDFVGSLQMPNAQSMLTDLQTQHTLHTQHTQQTQHTQCTQQAQHTKHTQQAQYIDKNHRHACSTDGPSEIWSVMQPALIIHYLWCIFCLNNVLPPVDGNYEAYNARDTIHQVN